MHACKCGLHYRWAKMCNKLRASCTGIRCVSGSYLQAAYYFRAGFGRGAALAARRRQITGDKVNFADGSVGCADRLVAPTLGPRRNWGGAASAGPLGMAINGGDAKRPFDIKGSPVGRVADIADDGLLLAAVLGGLVVLVVLANFAGGLAACMAAGMGAGIGSQLRGKWAGLETERQGSRFRD